MNYPIYDQLCTLATLQEAWKVVEAKGSMGGIDRQSVDSFGKNAQVYLVDLADELSQGSYVPEPYLEIAIPKDGNEFRVLGLPTVKDKIVQQALKELMEPIWEEIFLNTSYGYRSGKSAFKAIRRTQHFIRTDKCVWLTSCDIDGYFDNIKHSLLLNLVENQVSDERILHLVRLWISMAKVSKDLNWKAVKKGIPQGNVLSPLLANIYLHELDRFVGTRKYGYVRYADDFVLLTQTPEQAEDALLHVSHFLQNRLQLKLNPGAHIQHVKEGFEFLGIWFTGFETSVTEEKFAELLEGLKEDLYLDRGAIQADYLGKLKTLKFYYGRILSQHLLEQMDAHLEKALVRYFRKLLEAEKIERSELMPTLFLELSFFSEAYEQRRIKSIKQIIKRIRSRQDPYETVLENVIEDRKAAEKIRRKRRAYQERASEARELLITRPGVFIGKSRNQVTVKLKGKVLDKVPLKHLDNITVLSSG